MSVIGRAAVNQKSGDAIATSADRHACHDERPAAIQNRTSTKADSVPAISPQNASPAAARRSRSQPGMITPTAAVDAFAIAMKIG